VLVRATELLAGFEGPSVMALLHAACSSPTARQAGTSCAALLMSSWAAPPAGSKIATSEDLAPLVQALREGCPELAMVEDFLPLDPRKCVHFRATSECGSWDFRIHPGGLESPLQVLQAIVNYAEALDPVLLPRAGFGVADMLQMAVRMLDAELSILVPAWSGLQMSQESPPAVTEAEVAAAGRYLERWHSDEVFPAGLLELQDGDDGGRLERAARGLTIDYQRLSFDAGPDRAHVGPALFVQCPAGVLPVPSALIIESLTAAVTAALQFLPMPGEVQAHGPDRGTTPTGPSTEVPRATVGEAAEAARRWRDRADSDLAWACRGIPATILFGHLADDGHELLLIGPGHRHVVAVDLVTGLTNREIAHGIQAARERLATFGPGSGFRVSPQPNEGARPGHVTGDSPPPAGTTDSSLAWLAGTADAMPFAESLMAGETAALAGGTVVTRVVVVDGPWQHGPHWGPEIPACTLDEFRSLFAAQDWQSTDREELWSFLDELTTLGADSSSSGCNELVCWSILDAWEAWKARGMLCPAWVNPDTCAFIPPRDLDDDWERDALLEPVDAILACFGMSAAREWAQLIPTPVPTAQPGSDEWSLVVTLSLYKPRRIWWVAADMGLLVTADLEFRDELSFSRAALGTLANAIEDTLREVARRSPHAWQLWRQAHGDHPVAIQVTPGRLPEEIPALRFIGMDALFDELYVDPHRLAKLPPADVHALIGEALAFSMLARLQPAPERDGPADNPHQENPAADERAAPTGEMDSDPGSGKVMELTPSDEDIQHTDTFRTAWQSIQPRLAQRAGAAPFLPYALTQAQTLTEGGQNRARRTIARRLRTRLDPGTHPLRVVLAELCPGALDALTDAAHGYVPRAALAAACAELERALSDRFASRMGLELNLGSPWADETLTELDIGTSSDETQRSRVAELLIERLLSQPPAGSLVPDRRDVHQLLDLASAALDASLEAQYAFAAIRPAALEISEFGDLDIVPTGSAKADIRGWQQAQFEDQARAFTSDSSTPSGLIEARSAVDPSDPGSEETIQPETLRSILEQIRNKPGFQALNADGLLRVDDQLIEHCGFGLDSVRAVLATVTSWEVPAEPHPPIAQVSRAAFVDDVTTWSGLPREQIDAAVAACTLTGERIRQEGLRYWQLKERSARLALRPLIEPPDTSSRGELWLLPRCAHRTQNLLMTYLNDQQLPWPDSDLPKPVRRAVKAWHKLAEDHLESELAAAARSAGLACRHNLTQQKAALEGLALHGEIDLIAADRLRRRIWVMEAKHLRRAFSPLEIGFRVADFHGAGALATGLGTNEFRQFRSRTFRPNVQRVVSNANAVQHNRQAAARLISAVSPGSNLTESATADWEVIPLMVTSRVDISAFVQDPRVPFVLIDHLRELLMSDGRPPPGWWSPWTH
jgi:hypothetical protein